MPSLLRVRLENDSAIQMTKTARVIKTLGRLCDQDTSVEAAYLCHPAVQPITKSKDEGNLCGYRNIQMMMSYVIGAEVQGYEHFCNGLPSILELQDMIEVAWDKGINSEGRVETGGIRGTRKYIGTPEVRHRDGGSCCVPSCQLQLGPVPRGGVVLADIAHRPPFLHAKRPACRRPKHSFAVSVLAAR